MDNHSEEDRPMFEAAGYKVYFTHLQISIPAFKVMKDNGKFRQLLPAAKGATACHIISEHVGYTDVSRCGMGDNFSRSTGRKMALRKVLLSNFSDRRQRALFWYEYFMALGMATRAYTINTKWHVKPVLFHEVPYNE